MWRCLGLRALSTQLQIPKISVGISNGTDHFGLVRPEYSGPALKVADFERSGHFDRSDQTDPFHLTKLLSPVQIFRILLLTRTIPKHAMANGSGLCNRNVPFQWARGISEISNRNVFLRASAHSHDAVLLQSYCWFSHDFTKIQTKKLSILPRFYFHDALEQLKTNFHTNFRFKRVLGFVIEYS